MSQLMDLYLKAINEDSSLRFDAEKRIDEVRKCDEALKGKQHKLDVDKDGKIEGEDLAKLRAMKEEEELNLEDFSLEELQDFMVSEDFQQLDELSKTTLGNYVKKASKSAVTATDIASREDEKRPFSTRSIKNYQLADRRQKGISKAVSRLTKEETEQLDELSKETLGKYIKKSSQYRGYHGMDAGAAGYRSKDQKDAIDKMGRRQRGVEKAVDKLTKESIEAMVSAVLDGDQESASDAFSQAIGEMISDRMDAIKQDIASGL